MSKKCPKCLEIYDDNNSFCSSCGSRLVENPEEIGNGPSINIGDGNAISGGVNIDSSQTITSHDTHYHSTILERTKSDSELRLEAANQLRAKAEEIISERGRIDSLALSQLRPLALQLGIDDNTFKTIIKDVRSNNSSRATELGSINSRYLQQAQQALQSNDWNSLSSHATRLEAMASLSPDENVHYLYNVILAITDPAKCIDIYERQTDENYWRSFWAIISYIRKGRYEEATKNLVHFQPTRFDKPETDSILLEAYFQLIRKDNDRAQEFIDDILDKPSEQLAPLLRAIESSLYKEDTDSQEARFYLEQFLPKPVKESKKKETVTEDKSNTGIEKKKDTAPASGQDTTPAYVTKALNNIISATRKCCTSDEFDRLEKNIRQLDQEIRNSTDEQMHFFYFMILAVREPEKCIKTYESRKIVSYWLTFWAAYSYAYLDRKSMALKAADSLLSSGYSSFPSANVDLLKVLIDIYLYAIYKKPDPDTIKKAYGAIKGAVSDKLVCFNNAIKYVLAIVNKDSMSTEDMFYSLWVVNAGWRYGETENNATPDTSVKPTGKITDVHSDKNGSQGNFKVYAKIQVDNHLNKKVIIRLTLTPVSGGESHVTEGVDTCMYPSTLWEKFTFTIPEGELIPDADDKYHLNALIQVIDEATGNVITTTFPTKLTIKVSEETLNANREACNPIIEAWEFSLNPNCHYGNIEALGITSKLLLKNMAGKKLLLSIRFYQIGGMGRIIAPPFLANEVTLDGVHLEMAQKVDCPFPETYWEKFHILVPFMAFDKQCLDIYQIESEYVIYEIDNKGGLHQIATALGPDFDINIKHRMFRNNEYSAHLV